MATRLKRLLLALALLVPVACGGDESSTCPGPVTRRCLWNEGTGQFDRACTYQCAPPSDAGPCQHTVSTDDGAAEAAARTDYYSNDPRLQLCRD
jgi:hypothetical protein